MKKFIYILLVSVLSSVAFTSCTEEEVVPKTESDSAPGGMPSSSKG